MSTLYFRSDSATVNGLTANKLLDTNSGSPTELQVSGYGPFYVSAQIVKRTSGGAETVLGSYGSAQSLLPLAYDTFTNDLQATWACPATTLTGTDSVVVRQAIGYTPGGTEVGTRAFSTAQGISSLLASTWTFRRCLYQSPDDGGDGWGFSEFRFGGTTSPSRIDGISLDAGASAPLAIASATHAHTAAAPALTQHHALAIGSASHALTSAVVALVQHHTVVVASAAHTITSDEVVATQHSPPLVIAGAAHTLASGDVALTQHSALAIAGATHALASGDVALAQHHILAIGNAAHAHTAGATALVQHHSLTIVAAAHALVSPTVAITQGGTLGVDSAAHGLTSGEVALVERKHLAIVSGSHALTSDAVTLLQAQALAIGDAIHAHAADTPALLQRQILAIASVAHALSSDEVTVSERGLLLVVDSAVHSITSSSVAIAINPSVRYDVRLDSASGVSVKVGQRDTEPRLGINGTDPRVRLNVEGY